MAAELLESRHLLASLTPVKSPIDNVLLELAHTAAPTGQGPVDRDAIIAAAKDAWINVNPFGDVGITITATDTAALLPDLEPLGMGVTANLPNHHLIEGYLPLTSLESLLELRDEGLMGVRAIYTPVTRAGAVANQADVVHETERVRAALPTGYDGSGFKIGVLSDSYDSLGGAATDIASLDLPAGIEVIEDIAGGSDEGRAMLQLVHDLAPGASLSFATAFTGEAGFAQNIRNLAATGSDVIVDDVFYFAEPMFQDGIIAQAVDDVVTNDGVPYFSSAGNSADQSYESSTIQFATDSLGFGPFGQVPCYDFNTGFGTDTRQSISLSTGQSLLLSFQWDDPFYTTNGVDTDLDIFLVVAGTNDIVAASFDENVVTQTPVEVLSYTNSSSVTDYEIIINRFAGPSPQRLKYVDFRGQMTVNEFDTNSSTINGHAAAANAIAVAAAAYFDHSRPESFSSHGTTSILFDAAGNRLPAVQVRNTPQITAIDGTNTTFFGQDVEGDGRPNFFGTSAAAPHAAAIAALVQQANPTFTPQQIYQRMQDTAIDLGAPGWDNTTGFGLVNAYDAIFGPAQPTQLPYQDGFEDGALSQAWETNTNNNGRITLSDANAPATGTRHLSLDAFVPFQLSRNEAILHLNLAKHIDITLDFKVMETSDSDHPMAATFTGSVNADGVALSVDGVTWHRLISLTGTASTDTYQLHTFDLSAFVTDNGLTLTNDVRIKFQQYGNSNAPLSGIFFDDIEVDGTFFNTPPIAVDDPLPNALEDEPLVIPQGILTANDVDAENDVLTVTAVVNAVGGSVSLDGGVITFLPDPDYSGPASFEYTVSDGFESDVGLVTFEIIAVNDPPIAVDDEITGAIENTPLIINVSELTLNDIDAELEPLTVVAVGNALHGSVSLEGSVITYTPNPGYDGPASFEYTVSDGNSTDIGLVTFIIAGSNDPPTVFAGTLLTDEDTSASGVLTATDPELSELTYSVVRTPAHGLITSFNASTGAYTYLPSANYNGPDSFTFKANDGALDSVLATISITVLPVNDAPILKTSNPSLGSIAQGTSNPAGTVINSFLTGNVSEVDGSLLRGIAISWASGAANGRWQYKFDAVNWTDLPAVSQAAALLLPGRASVRFIPSLASFSGQVRISYRAWDQTQGVLGGTLDLSNRAVSTGGSTSISANYDFATLKINKPPLLTQNDSAPTAYVRNSKPGVNFMLDASGNKTRLTDPDNPTFAAGVLRVRTSSGKRIGDRVFVSWSFSYVGTNVIYQGRHIGDVLSNGFDGNDLAIRFNSAATREVADRLINSLKFRTVAGLNGTRTLKVSISDGDGGTSNTLTRTVIVS